jgi:hypothetical protein
MTIPGSAPMASMTLSGGWYRLCLSSHESGFWQASTGGTMKEKKAKTRNGIGFDFMTTLLEL